MWAAPADSSESSQRAVKADRQPAAVLLALPLLAGQPSAQVAVLHERRERVHDRRGPRPQLTWPPATREQAHGLRSEVWQADGGDASMRRGLLDHLPVTEIHGDVVVDALLGPEQEVAALALRDGDMQDRRCQDRATVGRP
jgi:hypothetical protein